MSVRCGFKLIPAPTRAVLLVCQDDRTAVQQAFRTHTSIETIIRITCGYRNAGIQQGKYLKVPNIWKPALEVIQETDQQGACGPLPFHIHNKEAL